MDQGVHGFRGPEIGVEVEFTPDTQQATDLGALADGFDLIPLGASNGTHEHGIGRLTEFQCFGREWLAAFVDARAAKRRKLKFKFNPVALRTLTASSMTSGPIPSPGNTATRKGMAHYGTELKTSFG
jgi:hypothetical protein